MNYLQDVFDRLATQTLQPDAIYANIPYTSSRLGQDYIIPEDLNLPPNAQIIRCIDVGPATKLIGCLEQESDPETNIITIDDDQIYDDQLIERLVKGSLKYPDSVVCNSALNNGGGQNCMLDRQVLRFPQASYAEGFAGVLYKRKFITQNMLDYYCNNKMSKECFLSDDLTISKWITAQGTDVIRLPKKLPVMDKEIDKNNPLHQENRKYVYEACMSELNKTNLLN
jgi:hypothetical protein